MRFRIYNKNSKKFFTSNSALVDSDGCAWSVHDEFCIKQDFIVQLFSGMKDIHGKDIYEGDIVSYRTQEGRRYADEDYNEFISEVVFKDGAFHPRYLEQIEDDSYYNYKVYHLEVIGNIFDTKIQNH